MSNTTLNWELREILKEYRDDGRWAVWACFVLHGNVRNRAWPSIETIMKETDWGRESVVAAIKWLKETGQIEPVPYGKRAGEEEMLHQRLGVYQLTGVAVIDGKTYKTLHFNSSASEISVSESMVAEPKGIDSSKDVASKDISGPSKEKPRTPAQQAQDAIDEYIGQVFFSWATVKGLDQGAGVILGKTKGVFSRIYKDVPPVDRLAVIKDFVRWWRSHPQYKTWALPTSPDKLSRYVTEYMLRTTPKQDLEDRAAVTAVEFEEPTPAERAKALKLLERLERRIE